MTHTAKIVVDETNRSVDMAVGKVDTELRVNLLEYVRNEFRTVKATYDAKTGLLRCQLSKIRFAEISDQLIARVHEFIRLNTSPVTT